MNRIPRIERIRLAALSFAMEKYQSNLDITISSAIIEAASDFEEYMLTGNVLVRNAKDIVEG